MIRSALLSTLVLLVTAVTGPVVAQVTAPSSEPSTEAKVLAEGWAAIARGDKAAASKAADRVLSDAPRSLAGVTLAVDVDILRGDPLAGLSTYERWLGERKLEDGYVLRRIARAHLRWVVRQAQHPGRLEAAKALTADGDTETAASLGQAATAGGFAETRVLASLGHPRAVQALIAELRGAPAGKLGTINALVESRSKSAIPALMELLSDPREDHRAAAADALGRLGASESIPRLRPLLEDPVFPVRIAAASALYRLEDYGGVNLLDQLMASEHPAVRLGAAEAMSVRPMGSWLSVVRELTTVDDETVQMGAARLIAPHEPDTAAAVLERLQQSGNLAIREEASRLFVQRVVGDFAALRRFLRSADGLASVRAADRILELTR